MTEWGSDRAAHDEAAELAMRWGVDDVRLDEEQPSGSADALWLRWLYFGGEVAGMTLPYNFAFAAPHVAGHCQNIDPEELHACVLTHRSVAIARDHHPAMPGLTNTRSVVTVVVTEKTAAIAQLDYSHVESMSVAAPVLHGVPLDVDGIAHSPYVAVVLAMTECFPLDVRNSARARFGLDGDGG